MKTCFFKLTLLAGSALLASHVFAQPVSQQGDSSTTIALKSAPSTPKPLAVTTTNLAAHGKTALPSTGVRAVIAAGSVLLLSDGIVDSAAMAQIQPPAPGFVYER